MLNSCSFIGNLGQDPEVKSFQNGGRVANLRLAVSEKWKNKSGERQEKTEWVSIAIFSEGLVGVAERFLRKGSKVYVSGKLSTRKWQAADGSDRYSTEVVLQGPQAQLVMLDGAPDRGERKRGYDDQDNGGWVGQAPPSDDLDDEIPF